MNWIDVCALFIDILECFFVVSISICKLEKFETYEGEQYFYY